MTASALELVTIGRASVDLYGQQIGTRLEDTASFSKSVGGCPANIAIGTARLGLASALLTRVGGEQFGGFITEQLAREGVATDGITTDPERLTALAILAVEDDTSFPMIFYRENCADMALCAEDVDADLIARAGAVLVTGTHFSKSNTAAAQDKAIDMAKAHGGRVIFDIDYRPNLWGLAGHAEGGARYVASETVSNRMKPVLPHCDLIVGTEEEILIAAGESDLLAALKTIRGLSAATIVLKRGPQGCIVYEGAIGDDLEAGIVGQGFSVEVYNTLGAGDAFMSGFLRGYLRNEPYETCATWANACGAITVSRLLCAPEIPTFAELEHFLAHGSAHKALRKDAALNHIHWATNRRKPQPRLMALAIDHRLQLETIADELGVPRARIADFKPLAVKAACRVAGEAEGYGMLLDDTYGRQALFDAAKHPNLWVGRPVEEAGSRPLRFQYTQDMGSRLVEWPVDHCIKCLSFYHPDDPAEMKAAQQDKLITLSEAARAIGRELLVEIIASKAGPVNDETFARVLAELYALGIKPDWWKLEPQATPAAWAAIDTVIEENDPYCRGVVMLGLEAPQAELETAFNAARQSRQVRGFAVGRTIFADPARDWLSGAIDDETAIATMAQRFDALTRAWQATGAQAG